MTSARVANRNHMTSFYFRTIGCLARNPELVTSDEGSYYRFCLTGHDYTEDDQGQLKVEFQSLWFVATQATGALIAWVPAKATSFSLRGRFIDTTGQHQATKTLHSWLPAFSSAPHATPDLPQHRAPLHRQTIRLSPKKLVPQQ